MSFDKKAFRQVRSQETCRTGHENGSRLRIQVTSKEAATKARESSPLEGQGNAPLSGARDIGYCNQGRILGLGD